MFLCKNKIYGPLDLGGYIGKVNNDLQIEMEKIAIYKILLFTNSSFCSFPNYNDSRSLITYRSIIVHGKFLHVANTIISIMCFLMVLLIPSLVKRLVTTLGLFTVVNG